MQVQIIKITRAIHNKVNKLIDNVIQAIEDMNSQNEDQSVTESEEESKIAMT